MKEQRWALACGVPDAVCHIIAAHADEGNLVQRTPEAFIVHHAEGKGPRKPQIWKADDSGDELRLLERYGS